MRAMGAPESKKFGEPILFDPSEGQTVIAPPAPGPGNWAGAPSAVYDGSTSRLYLCYRVRRPRPIRGGECYIAESDDGVTFTTIWAAKREALGSASMERFCLTKSLDARWLLYPSYVDPADGRWRIDIVEAASPGAFDLSERKALLTATQVGTEGVKDPWVMIVNGLYYMLVSCALTLDELSDDERADAHSTADIYSTGLTRSATALAVSGDGREYEWLGNVFSPRPGAWDAYAARLGCLIPTPNGWLGYYDGAAAVEGNYEERTGVVQTWDLRHFYRLSYSGPHLVSPEGSGSLRYVDAVLFDDEILIYYEYARADGSHELRLNRVQRK